MTPTALSPSPPTIVMAPDGFLGLYRRIVRDPAKPPQLSDLLALIGYDASPAVIETWPLAQRIEAEAYACNVHLRASDNVLRKHPKPAWMPKPWQGQAQGEGIFEGPGGTVIP